MLNRRYYSKLIILSLITAGILFSGCEQPVTSSGIAPVDQTVDTTPPQTGGDQQAAKLYVDAMIFKDKELWDNALRKLDEAIGYAPDFSLAWSFKGDIFQQNEQYAESADAYEAASKIDPWSFKDFANLGKVAQILEQYRRAVRAYVTACDLDPDHYGVHLGAGRCYYELKDYELAFGYTERAKEIDPEQADPDVLLGDIYQAKDDYTSAINSYRRALETAGNVPKTMVSLAAAYAKAESFDKNKRFKAAEELLTDAIEADPNDNVAYHYLGYIQLNLYRENLDLALNSYSKAVDIENEDWMAHKGLGVVHMLKAIKAKAQSLEEKAAQHKQKAIEQWNKSLAIKPEQPQLRIMMSNYLNE